MVMQSVDIRGSWVKGVWEISIDLQFFIGMSRYIYV